jgi:hypothetical protein
MKLITKEILRKLPALNATEHIPEGDKVAVVKFFTPWSNWTWYGVEGHVQEDGEIMFFGRVEGHETELGYFSLRELESIRGPFGLKIERDMHFEPRALGSL